MCFVLWPALIANYVPDFAASYMQPHVRVCVRVGVTVLFGQFQVQLMCPVCPLCVCVCVHMGQLVAAVVRFESSYVLGFQTLRFDGENSMRPLPLCTLLCPAPLPVSSISLSLSLAALNIILYSNFDFHSTIVLFLLPALSPL